MASLSLLVPEETFTWLGLSSLEVIHLKDCIKR
jgi:hypothetical protein